MSLGQRASTASFVLVALLLVGSLAVFWGIHYFGYSAAYGWGKSAAIMVVALVILMQLEDRLKGPKVERWKPLAMLLFSVAVAMLTWAYASSVVAQENAAKTFMQDTLAFDHEASKPLQDIGARIMAFRQDDVVTAQNLTSRPDLQAAKQRVQDFEALVNERDAASRTYFDKTAQRYATLPEPARSQVMQGFQPMREGMASVYADMGKAQTQWADAVLALLNWADANNSSLRLEGGRVTAMNADTDSQFDALLGHVQEAQNNVNVVLDGADKRRLAMKQRSDEVTAEIKAAR
jgi:hypothetical protein